MRKYDILVPIVKDDLHVFLSVLPFWKEYLPFKKIIFAGPASVKESIEQIEDIEYKFINENEIINLNDIKQIICKYTNGNSRAVNRAGWYLQQFIKMQYAMICEDEYYLVWDSDTVPLHKISMFSKDKPVFDMKNEYHQPYFDAIERLLGKDLVKSDKSFISEHMIINCAVMRELTDKIGSLDSMEGNTWYEKVLGAVNTEDLTASGFSEYETYGAYTSTYYPDLYEYRDWKSERRGFLFFDIEDITSDDIVWMGKVHDSFSFEKTEKFDNPIKKLLKHRKSHILKFTTYIQLMKIYNTIFSHKNE